MGVTMRRKRRNGGEGTAARQWQPLTFEQATDVADVVQLRRSLRRRMIALRVFAIVLAFVLQWRSSQQLSAQTRMVNQRVLGWPYPQAENKLRDARAYNQRLAASGQPILGEAVDPFSQRAGGSSVSEKGDSAASKDSEYQSLLDTGGGIMGSVSIPKISVNLPIYHGTSEEALAAGAGHLYGTSLPAVAWWMPPCSRDSMRSKTATTST